MQSCVSLIESACRQRAANGAFLLFSKATANVLNLVVTAADFHKVPLFVQAGHAKSMDGREFPAVRQFRELIVRIATFHRKQSPAADAQVTCP